MSRTLTPAITNAIQQTEVFPYFAVEMLFDNNPVRTWTGQGTLTLDGEDYLGVGQLLNVSAIEETSEMAVKGATLTLSGVPSTSLSLALTQPYQGRVCNIYFGVIGQVGASELFSGYMDQMNIVEDAESSTIELMVENKLIDLERARVARFTSGYQKSVYPDDLGLDFIEDLQDRKLPWGRKAD